MLGEPHRGNPTVHVPPWTSMGLEDPSAEMFSPMSLRALSPYMSPSPAAYEEMDSDSEAEADSAVDAYSCDHFRMFEFKVRRCARGRSHDWTECPYAHPGEKARRRDPRRFHYSGTACPDFRKGHCKRGDACEFAHGVFECWLHPARYRTQPCKDGVACRRRVCFFAHTADQLRLLPASSSLSPPPSPPSPSPRLSRSVGDVVASLRSLQLGKVNSLPSTGFGSPRGALARTGFCSLPTTPTRPVYLNHEFYDVVDEEPVMERVESGRGIRANMLQKLKSQNAMDRVDPSPDVDWVADLLN